MLPDHPDSITTCAGCGGRNAKNSTECDWCGRSFVSKGGRLRVTVWQVMSSLLILALVAAVASLAILNAGRNLPTVRATVPTSTAPPTLVPTPAVTPRVTAPNPPTPTTAPVVNPTQAPEPPTPEPTPTPQPQMARIANTSGQGVSVRLEPGPQAARAGALREGTTVLLTGNDQTVAARPWREIETEDHRLKGWVLADFLQMLGSAP